MKKLSLRHIVRLLILTILFSALFEFGDLWLRGGVMGFFIALLMNMAEIRSDKIEEYEKRLEMLRVGHYKKKVEAKK